MIKTMSKNPANQLLFQKLVFLLLGNSRGPRQHTDKTQAGRLALSDLHNF